MYRILFSNTGGYWGLYKRLSQLSWHLQKFQYILLKDSSMIPILLQYSISLRPDIPQDSMRFYVFSSAEPMHFYQVPNISMKFQPNLPVISVKKLLSSVIQLLEYCTTLCKDEIYHYFSEWLLRFCQSQRFWLNQNEYSQDRLRLKIQTFEAMEGLNSWFSCMARCWLRWFQQGCQNGSKVAYPMSEE